jgi:6-phosphofructo-2-kinase / fructose-2,6-biphosphatase 2
MNVQVTPRVIYLTRHGESEHNLKGLIGGDADLSVNGQRYAQKLKEYFDERQLPNLQVWCSSMRRTRQTVKHMSNVTLRVCHPRLGSDTQCFVTFPDLI